VTSHKIPANRLHKIAEVLKSVGHPVRLEIIALLEARNRLNVFEIQQHISVPVEQSMLSHHLTKMKDKGILSSIKEGQYVFYSLKDPNISNLLDCMSKCKL